MEKTFFTKPSQEFKQTTAPDVCFVEDCHPARKVPFQPDENFYNSELCEGLWVCCTKKVSKGTLEKACALIRGTLPIELRRKFLDFRAQKWCVDPGPMRLIIMANKEVAGSIIEVQGTSLQGMTGSNHTYSPWAFTNENDFLKCSNIGKLTLHEITHAADMVIRQQIDPFFHEHVQLLYNSAVNRSSDNSANWKDRGTSIPDHFITNKNNTRQQGSYDFGGRYNGGLYAMANRDEYLAETHCMLRGITSICGEPTPAVANAVQSGLCSSRGLFIHDPDIYSTLVKFFSHQDSVIDWPEPDECILRPVMLHENNQSVSSTRWRIRSESCSKWAWDIHAHKWNWASHSDGKIIFSGCAGDNYSGDPFWGGRKDSKGILWLGKELLIPSKPTSLVIIQSEGHSAVFAIIEFQSDNGTWQEFAVFSDVPKGKVRLQMN